MTFAQSKRLNIRYTTALAQLTATRVHHLLSQVVVIALVSHSLEDLKRVLFPEHRASEKCGSLSG